MAYCGRTCSMFETKELWSVLSFTVYILPTYLHEWLYYKSTPIYQIRPNHNWFRLHKTWKILYIVKCWRNFEKQVHSGRFTLKKGQREREFQAERTAAVSVDRGGSRTWRQVLVGSPNTCSSTHTLVRLVEVESLQLLPNRCLFVCLFQRLTTPVHSNKLCNNRLQLGELRVRIPH